MHGTEDQLSREQGRRSWREQDGFTLIELLAVCLISVTMLTLGAAAARHYWIVRSLEGAPDSIEAELSAAQERSRSESHPVAYGLRIRPGSQAGSASDIGMVRYDYGSQSCTQVSTMRLDAGVYVSSASFTVLAPGPTQTCRTSIAGAGADQFVFVFARGTATGGSMTFAHRDLDFTRDLTVSQLTGRVETP